MRQYIILLLLLASLATAQIDTGSINPSTVNLCGGFSLETTITAADITNSGNTSIVDLEAELILPQNGVLTLTTSKEVDLGDVDVGETSSISPSWKVRCTEPLDANYTLYIKYTGDGGFSANSMDDATVDVTVHASNDITPPQIIDSGPSGEFNANVNLTIETNEKATCRYDIENENYEDMRNEFGETGNLDHKERLVLGSGEYKYYVRCEDENSVDMDESEIIEFTIDTKAPEVTAYSPTRVLTSFTTLNLTTNENAECRYATSTKVEYEDMTKRFIGSTKSHTATLTQLSHDENKFYIKCKDQADNIAASDYMVEVIRDPTPTAEIELSDSSPVKPGVIKVTLTTSEDMQEIPKLTYTLDDGDSKKVILTGEDNQYEGFMIIESGDSEQIGLFSYEGTDIFGNEGDTITDGAIFIVDPQAPPAPSNIKVKRIDEATVYITWNESRSDLIDRFYIYRSTSKDVTDEDYYAVVTTNKFTDRKATGNFYYRIAAVDEADNSGDLSRVVSTTGGVYEPEDTSSYVDELKVDESSTDTAISIREKIDQLSNGLRDTRTNLREKSPDDVQLLDLVSQTRQGDLEIRELRAALKIATDEGSKSKLNDVERRYEELLKLLPKALHVVEEETAKKVNGVNIIKETVQSLLDETGHELKEKEIGKYVKLTKDQTEPYQIEQIVRKVVVEYYDESEKEFTIIRHKLNFKGLRKSDQNSVSIILKIPKEVAERVSDAKFDETKIEIIKEDPLIRLDLKSMNNQDEVVFYVENNVPMRDASETAAVIFHSLDEVLVGDGISDSVSGAAIFSSKGSGFSMFWLILGAFVLLGAYFIVKPMATAEFVKKLRTNDIPTLAKQAHEKLDVGDKDSARKIYSKMMAAYDKTPDLQKRTAYSEIVKVYHRF